MTDRDRCQQTFVESVLMLLEEKFPWLGKENDEPVSGADTVDELVDLHRSLIDSANRGSQDSLALHRIRVGANRLFQELLQPPLDVLLAYSSLRCRRIL